MTRLKTSLTTLKNTTRFYMSRYFQTGIIVSGIAVLLYLIYTEIGKKEEKRNLTLEKVLK